MIEIVIDYEETINAFKSEYLGRLVQPTEGSIVDNGKEIILKLIDEFDLSRLVGFKFRIK